MPAPIAVLRESNNDDSGNKSDSYGFAERTRFLRLQLPNMFLSTRPIEEVVYNWADKKLSSYYTNRI